MNLPIEYNPYLITQINIIILYLRLKFDIYDNITIKGLIPWVRAVDLFTLQFLLNLIKSNKNYNKPQS